jgi:hypothetical protein
MPSNNLPNPQSYEQIESDAISAYAAKLGIDDFNVGSAVLSFFEVVALTTARASGDIFQILRDFSVDRATGDALQRLATENNITPITARPATGPVNVIDTSFIKISTKIYAGSMPPNIGSTIIMVSDASQFPASGAVYIGRGTPNIEGPLAYSTPPTQVGNFWTITLNSPTTKFHNLGESVILAQGGNRSIPVNAIVISPSVGASADIQYQVTTAAVILDGETSVTNVPVSALLPGASGNVPIGAIKSFASVPFPGATVTNSLPFTTGSDNETDDQLRVRIKRALASIGLGTATAVKSSVIGATPSDEQATVVSDDLIQASYGAVLFIDNGGGYEAKSNGVGLESIVDSAIGGEQFFQLATGGRQAPVAKAFLQTTNSAPFDVIAGDTLAVIVGGQTYQHTFASTDFRSPGSVTAYEITASINADTALGFEATTAGGGTFVVIRAKNEGDDSIQITTPTTSGRDASVQLGFPAGEIQTLRLFKNQIPLSKDGNSATLFTQDQQLWSATIANGDTLILSVDGTSAITYTFADADFIATGLYTSVNATNSLEAWVQVMNAKLTGVTAEIVGQQISISSNLGANNRAALIIDASSSLVSKGMFTSLLGLSSIGKASDYTLNRNTAQFELVTPLAAGDNLTAGSNQTEARLQSGDITAGSVTLAATGYVWILIDEPGTIIPTGVAGSSLLAVTKPSTNVIRYTSNVSSAFANVQIGDYVIIWSAELPATDRLEGRVYAITNTTLDLLVTPAEYAAATTTTGVVFSAGFVVLRSQYAPQKFEVPSGTSTLDQIASALQAQTNSLIFTVQEEEFLIVRSRTKDTTGSVLIVTNDAQGQLLDLPVGVFQQSQDSLIAFYDTQATQAQMPLFIHSGFAAGTSASPPDSYITSFISNVALSANNPNNIIVILQPYGAIQDAQPYHEFVQETSISGTTVGIANEVNIRRLRSNDRFFVASPLNFGPSDTAVVVVDNDPSSGSFEIPLYRRAVTNTTDPSNPNNFNAYDVAAGATATFASNFGNSFDFSNYKVLMQAKKTLKPSPAKTALLYRSARWGFSGEKLNVGYVYPSVPNSPITSTVQASENVQILISLQSGALIGTSIDGSTEWNVTITSNNPSAGTDQVTYTWNGTGTAPNLSLSGGEYVSITNQTEFNSANIGVYRVSTQSGFTPTSTSFSVQRSTGSAVAQSGIATQVPNGIVFYAASPTTAAQINTYVNANLNQYFTSTIVMDTDTSGSGVIVLSTYEDSGFVSPTVQLKDGLNWISTSNIAGSPQFSLKLPLTLPTDVGYAFNNGEEVRLIPTTMDQVRAFISVLAVSGFTTVGTVGVVDRDTRLEFATDTLGSSGSIQIIGGLANSYQTPVLDSATRVDNSIMNISVDNVAGQGINSGQWFRLAASNQQKKSTLFDTNTSATLVGADPVAGSSTVELLNRQLNQRYFGKPRHHIRSQGRNFRIEQQGALVCLSWDGNGSSPVFNKAALNFNDAGGGTLNIFQVSGTSNTQYQILTGSANFNELSIGDLVTVAGMVQAANNGTFLVTGVSDDGMNLQVLNPSGANQYSHGSFTLNTNLTAGDTFTIGASTLVAGTNFAIGGSANATAINLSAVAGTLSGVTSSVNNNIVTITGISAGSTVALAYSGVGSVTVSGAAIAGDTFVAGNFSASSGVSEGDSVIINAPFNVLNQGTFRVIRRYNDSIWFENPNVVQEEVTLPLNAINLGFDATTDFMINATSHTQYLTWNGNGTQPFLELAQIGDVITFGTDFSSANQGSYMVLRSGAAQTQIASFVMPTGAQFAASGPGQYFLINSAGNINQYYVWFNVNSGNSDPAIGGKTGIQVHILNGDNAATVAANAAAVVGAVTGLTATSSAGVLTVSTTGAQTTILPSNVNIPAPFTVTIVQTGRRTFLECVNPSAVNESSVLVSSSTMVTNRPQMEFYEYDATIPGDQIVITNANFLTPNIGTYVVTRVIDRDNAIVTGTFTNVSNVSLNGIITALFVQEGKPYTGYKFVSFAVAQPGTTTRTLVTFDTNAQYDKISQAASVQLTSQNKLNFPTLIKNGLDSYRYNTGLIAEANRIIYGDPRDPTTYPGVGAAGANIFVREPLARRVQVGIDIRLNTGVPFAQTAEQVRNSVSSLVNSNDIGQSIAISAIVAVVSAIPGILAVSIASPTYDVNDDLIILSPGEKAIIIDPTLDISVSQVGS